MFVTKNYTCALNKSWSKYRVQEVIFSFRKVRYAVVPRVVTSSKPPELWEHKPHPVPLLLAQPEFVQSRFVRIVLGVLESTKGLMHACSRESWLWDLAQSKFQIAV